MLAAGVLLAGCGGDSTATDSAGAEQAQGRQDLQRDRAAAGADGSTATTGAPGEAGEASEAGEAGEAAAAPEGAQVTAADAGTAGTAEASSTATDGTATDGSDLDSTAGDVAGDADRDNPWAGTGAPQSAFLMPSGNVACVLAQDWVACQIAEHSYVPSEVFHGCRSTEADTILLREGSAPQWICSDHDLFATGYELGASELDYGSSFWGGSFNCLSDTGGVLCSDGAWTFRLARASYEFY